MVHLITELTFYKDVVCEMRSSGIKNINSLQQIPYKWCMHSKEDVYISPNESAKQTSLYFLNNVHIAPAVEMMLLAAL